MRTELCEVFDSKCYTLGDGAWSMRLDKLLCLQKLLKCFLFITTWFDNNIHNICDWVGGITVRATTSLEQFEHNDNVSYGPFVCMIAEYLISSSPGIE